MRGRVDLTTTKHPARSRARIVALRQGFALAAALFLGDAGEPVQAETTWLHAGGTAAELARVSGLPGADLPVVWKDDCFNPHQPAQQLGAWELVAVAPERSVPPQSSFALLSFAGWSGDQPGQIPADAIVTSATLWVHVEQAAGSFRIQAKSLPVADVAWLESVATLDHPAAADGPAWSGGTLLESLQADLGSFAAPIDPGWFRVPLELAGWLDALREGRSGGLALVAQGPVTGGTRGVFWSSANAANRAHRPALWVGWHRPNVGLRLLEVAPAIATHGGLPTPLVIQDPDLQSLSVDDEPIAPTAAGIWRLQLSPGPHRLEAVGSQGITARNVEVVERLINLAPPVRTASGRIRFGWDTLPGWTYILERGEFGGLVWEALYQSTDHGGWVGIDVPAHTRHSFFRLRARTSLPNGAPPDPVLVTP